MSNAFYTLLKIMVNFCQKNMVPTDTTYMIHKNKKRIQMCVQKYFMMILIKKIYLVTKKEYSMMDGTRAGRRNWDACLKV